MKSKRREERHEGSELQKLAEDFRYCVDRRENNYWDRMKANTETRNCVWAGQSWDGRKWSKKTRSRVFPWEGASDARVPLVDHYINTDVAMLMNVWGTQKILARSTNPAAGGAKQAFAITTLLRWQLYEQMTEAEDEAELLANLMLERGSAAMLVFWNKHEQLQRECIEFEKLQEAARLAMRAIQQGQDSDALRFQALLPTLIADSSREAEAMEFLRGILTDPPLPDARLKKLLRDLRTDGKAYYPHTIVACDRPALRACAWNEDVFLPPENCDPQKSRVVFLREELSETDLVERQRSMGYDENWVDQVIEKAQGVMVFRPEERAATRPNVRGRGEADVRKLYEVVTAFRRLYDDDGIAGIWTTVFNPTVSAKTRYSEDDPIGKHELLDYAHGEYPINLFMRERRSRLVDDSRGVGEIAIALQAGIKKQWDARVDRTDVATLPPSHHPPGEEPDAWGPGVQIPTLQADRFGYFDIPKYDPGSKEIEQSLREFADEYFGRKLDGSDGVDSNNLRQNSVRGWLKGWKRVCTQIIKLDQQYLPDEQYVNVVGTSQGSTMRVTREQIQGAFSIMLQFNVRHLDPEYTTELIGMMGQVLAMDATGRVDRDEAVQAALELIDPGYAERLLKPGEESSLEQIDDEKDVLAKMLLGIPCDVKGNEAFSLRKQVLTQIYQNSPTVQGLVQSNPQVKDLIETRLKQLDFNIQQKEVNPDIGRRLGTKPTENARATAGPATPPPAPA